MVDLAGPSIFVIPMASYSLTPNTDITVGGQIFASSLGAEFDQVRNVFYVELLVHF